MIPPVGKSCYQLHQLFNRDVVVIDVRNDPVNNLGEVCVEPCWSPYTYRNSGCTVYKRFRDLWQYAWLTVLIVIRWLEVNCIFVDVGQNFFRDSLRRASV